MAEIGWPHLVMNFTHLGCDVGEAIAYARQVNPDLVVLQVSARTDQGLAAWYDCLSREVAAATGSAPNPSEGQFKDGASPQ
jgi:hypothetical protein